MFKRRPQKEYNIGKYTHIEDPKQIEEIRKIVHMLDEGEHIRIVARQHRFFPGGSPITPNIIFSTDRKIIIRNPMLFGWREHVEYYPYKKITTTNLVQGRFTSSIEITAPGMATSLGINRIGIINAIPKEDAKEIISMIRKNDGNKRH